MFACVYGRSVPTAIPAEGKNRDQFSPLVDLAFTFSPLVEETAANTVVFDIAGQDLLFGAPVSDDGGPASSGDSLLNIAKEIARRAARADLKISIAIAVNPDTAIHAAQCFKGITIIDPGDERSRLAPLSLKQLNYSLGQIDPDRAEEIHETFALWGVRTFGDLARLPLAGVAERLGQDGVRLQTLAQGKSVRQLNLVRPPIGFEQSLELEHPISELEPLTFVLSRLLNQLCANLNEYALATNELRLRLVPDSASEVSGERTITLPVPMRNPKTLLRLLLFEIEREPPQSPIIAVIISAEPVKPRASQAGLFIPLAPEPEKLEITLARLAKLVGAANVGSPEILDTHRPDAFRMKKFNLNHRGHRGRNQNGRRNPRGNRLCVMGFRIFRPPWRAEVQTRQGMPTRLNARNEQSRVRGDIICAAGPWRGSGDWWRSDVWARDEWDVAVLDSTSNGNEILCRIYRDLTSEQWFVEGIYD